MQRKGKDFIVVGEVKDESIVIKNKEDVDQLKTLLIRESELKQAYAEFAINVLETLLEIFEYGESSVLSLAKEAKKAYEETINNIKTILEKYNIDASSVEITFNENEALVKLNKKENEV